MDAPYFDKLWFSSTWDLVLNQTATLKYYPVPDNTSPVINATLAITTSLSSESADFNDFFNIDITLKEYYSGKSTQLHYDRSDLIVSDRSDKIIVISYRERVTWYGNQSSWRQGKVMR